jgi:glycosyltransferase involved in cell wall biosynthesis
MRVLHCISTLGGGGAERQLAYLALEQRAGLGYEVHVACVAEGHNAARLRDGGVWPHVLAGRGNHDPRLLLGLLALARRVRPHVVQSWLTQMDVLGGLVARAMGAHWVLSERSAAACYPGTLKDRIREALARSGAVVVSNSGEGDRFWAARRVPAGRRHLVPNALPLREIHAAPVMDAAPGPWVLFVGRLAAEKNVLVVVDAMARLAAGGARGVLLGDGPLRGQVEAEVARRGLTGRILVPGYVPDAWGWMKRADVLLAPSRYEGHPNAVAEAMACGCPLVVSDIPAHRDLLDRGNALFVDPSDGGALAAAAASVLADPAGAGARAAAARAVAEKWSVEAAARRLDTVYRSLAPRAAYKAPRAGYAAS